MDEAISYVEAVYPDCLWNDFRVLGIRLRPLSIHAMMMLERRNSPLLNGNINKDPAKAQAELLEATLILSMERKEFLSWLQTDWKEQISLYTKQLYKSEKSLFKKRDWFTPYILREEIIVSEFQRLVEFVLPSLKDIPNVRNFESKTTFSFHGLQSLLLGAAECGYSRDDAYNEHILVVNADVHQHAQDTGGITMLSPIEADQQAHPEKYQQTVRITEEQK